MVLIVLTLFVILFFYTNILPSTETLVSKNIAEDVSSYTTLPQRRSLLIVGKGRSGTSFVSKMLAIGERVSKNNV